MTSRVARAGACGRACERTAAHCWAARPLSQVIMKGEKELVGTLRGFDVYVNMVLEDVTE